MNALRLLLQRDPAAALQAALQATSASESLPGETAFIAGAALYALGRVDEAEPELRLALRQNQAHRHAGMCLADLLRSQGRYRAAADTVETMIAANSGDAAFALLAIQFLRECQQDAPAERLWKSTQTNAGPDSQYIGGLIAMTLGEFASARQRFDRCIAMDADYLDAVLARVHAKPLPQQTHDDFEQPLQRAAKSRSRLSPANRVVLDFALGKYAYDRGEMADAFAHFGRANTEQLAFLRQQPAVTQTMPNLSRRAETSTSIEKSGRELVFVIGLPRSGTTLLATRLGQHPEIADRGEQPWLEMLDCSAISAYAYLQHLRQDDSPRKFYIDKNPLNFRFLETIARDFPYARILHCRRDPRDVAVSSYTQFFPHPDMQWAYSWQDILEFQQRYRSHIAQRPTGLAWMDLDYADLVSSPESTLRSVISFLGLDWDEHVLAVPADGVVNTASVWQARQPMHGQSLARWRRTAAFTPELIAAYGDQSLPSDWF